MKQINCVQELRGYGVLWVIVVHLSFIEDKYSGGTDYISRYVMFGHSGVDAFFVISGFMMVYINRNRPGGLKSLLSFAYQRIVRVYPIYWLYCLLLLPAYFLFPHMINVSEGNKVSLLSSFLLMPDKHLPLLPVAWTLIHEMYFYFVIALLMLFPQQVRWWGIAVWAILCVILFLNQTALPLQPPIAKLLANPINLEFVLGAGIAILLLNGRSSLAVPALILGLISYVAGYWFYVQATHELIIDQNWRVLLAGVPITLIIYGLVVLENSRGFTFAKPLRFIGDISYSAYLSHILVLSLIGRLWYTSGLQGPNYSILWLILSLIVCLVWSYLSFRFIESPSWQYAKRYTPFSASVRN